jgi:hypothetical protein
MMDAGERVRELSPKHLLSSFQHSSMASMAGSERQ